MSSPVNTLRTVLISTVLSLATLTPAVADDSEIFAGQLGQTAPPPNILFILDTSGSMDTRDGGLGTPTRLEIVRDAALGLVSSLDGVNIGLMRYSSDAQGGMVIEAVEDIATNRQAMLDRLNTFTPTSGSGNTPLSETYYEAALYLKGDPVFYGDGSTPETSTADSRVGGNTWVYKSPIQQQCQKNYIIYLTDGLPTSDNDANEEIEAMIGQACDGPNASAFPTNNGRCTDDLAGYLSSPNTDLSSTLTGNQNALTYMIGFGNDVAASVGYLNAVAAAGGTGAAYTANDAASLETTLETILTDIDNRSQTFVTPSISVNAFNRAQMGADLYFALFRAEETERWNGNLKKYKLQGTTIVDANGSPAVASGFFSAGATSLWSPTQDGSDVTAGGAVSQLPDPASRNLYTHLGASATLSDGSNALVVTNALITDEKLGLPVGSTARDMLINWARGYQNGDSNEPQVKFMGDPMHGQPAIVTYGGTAESPDTVAFVPTNDGFLHAIAGGNGQELWAFMPEELLPRLQNIAGITAGTHTYGLDGDIQVLRRDVNHDGIVNGSDYVWLFFGMRMGGKHYYALDVTNRNAPKLLWKISSSELPGVGQTWSPPVIAKVDVSSGNVNADKYVLIFGGGYDMGQEVQPHSADDEGNRIFMVDAETGDRLWYAGDDEGNLQLPAMTSSIPGRITVIDLDSDGFADRMYAGDMGGRIWRFDIFNGQAASSLVTGGVLANLGANGTPGATTANRRFYNAPDVALIRSRGADPYYNIAIGSGYRGHPLNTATSERFYSIRDKKPYAKLTAADYTALAPIVDGDLVDITANPSGTSVPVGALGWKFRLSERSGRAGEKVLAESTTVNNVILFPTFQPGTGVSANDPCSPVNTNRVYAMSVHAGRPALDFNDDGVTDNNDLSTDLYQTGIVGQINLGVLQTPDTDGDGLPDVVDPDDDDDGIPDESDPDDDNDGKNDDEEDDESTICLAGVEVLSKCVGVNGIERTFWQRRVD